MNTIFILNRDEEIIAVLSGDCDTSGCHFFNSKLTLEINKGASLTFGVDTNETDVVQHVKEENMVVVHDGEDYRLLIIKEVVDVHEDNYNKEVYCEDASIELIDEIILNEVQGKIEMGDVLSTILENTRWGIGEVDNTYIRNLKPNFKLKTVLNGIQELASQYDAEIDFTVEFAGNKIVSRKVHMKKTFGRTLGKRFEFGKDVTSIKRTVNTSDIKTAIIPFGATNEETGEVLTIEGVEWTKPDKPFNKPLGQTYLEDEEATELWGYKGNNEKRRAKWVAITFEECTNANELINYAQLQLNRFNKPKITYEASVIDLFRMTADDSYSFEKVGLGDMVHIIDHEFVPALALTSRVVKLELDLNDSSNTSVTLGTIIESIIDKDLKTQIEELNIKVGAVASSVDLSDIEDRLDKVESETGTGRWEQIQEVNNLLFGNSVGYHYMSEDNGIWIFDKPANQHPTKAVALKGGMIGLAKYDEQLQKWNVGTFIDGNQVNASMITTGTLKADRIEADSLTVKHFNQELKTIINSVGDKPSREEVTTSIQTAVDNITLSVKSIYATKSETESAKTTAITESKKYSDTKKEEAVSEAVQSSNSYADEKKAEAVTDANEYSDAKKDEAVAEAGKDAQAKADAVKTTLTKQIELKAEKTDVYTKSQTYSKSETDSKIQVAKESIELSVSGTYETKSNVENKVNTAKSEAILSAVQTSTSYADEVKEEAIDSANAYADEKKSEAIAQAGKDADAKVSTAKGDLQRVIDLKASKTDVYTKTETYTKAETDSAIKVAKDEITLGVSNTYETKTNVESKISTAKTEVTTTAKNYADTKKAEAITQAGKDADSKVNSAKTELNGKIDLKASKTDVYTKSETYTKAQTDSAINVAKDSINLGVSQTYETKTNVESKLSNVTNTLTGKIDGLVIGSRNLWKYTKEYNPTKHNVWCDNNTGAIVNSPAPHTTVDGFGVQRIAGAWLDRTQRVTIEPNTDYTLSAWIKWEGTAGVMYFYTTVGSNSGTVITSKIGTTSYKRVAITFNSGSGTSSTCRFECSDNTPYLIYGLKLEKGNKATDWTPAPEDIDSSIANVQTQVTTTNNKVATIETNLNSITSRVSSTESTVSTHTTQLGTVDSRINTAKTQAITDARMIPDRRNTNDNPQYYFTNYPKQTITEFKYANVIGIGSSAVYGTLETKVPWTDSSGGYPVQIFRSNSTATYERKGTSNTTWGAWIQVEDTIGSQNKSNNAQNNAQNYTDGQIKTVNQTITNKVAEIKTTTDAITSTVSKVEQIATSSLQGKMLYTDPTFKNGLNSVSVYNNSQNGTVTISRVSKSSDCPTTSGYMLKITTSGSASPGHGGFTFNTSSRASAVFITKFLAKIPSGYSLSWHTNSIGDGNKQEWLTSTAGTGKWTEYICKVACGASGSFSSTNYFALNGGSAPVTWYLAMATVFDITETSNIESRMETAEQKITPSAILNSINSQIGNGGQINTVSTILDKNGFTVNNGALRVKNNAGKTVLEGDSKGNLVLSGTLKSESSNGLYASLSSGGLTLRDSQKSEEVLRVNTTYFESNRDMNGVAFAMPQYADFMRFLHIAKPSLENGWSSSDTPYKFMDFWSSKQTIGSTTYEKGIHTFAPIYAKQKIQFKNSSQFTSDIIPDLTWNSISDMLGICGDNGLFLGYRNGETYTSRLVLTEGSHPGTGDNIRSWGNWNCSGYTVHNGTFSGNHVNSYANTYTRTSAQTHCIEAEQKQVRVNFEDVQITEGKAILNLPRKYTGIHNGYIVSSIVKKGRGDVWVSEESENRFILEGTDDIKVNVEVVIKLEEASAYITRTADDSQLCFDMSTGQPIS